MPKTVKKSFIFARLSVGWAIRPSFGLLKYFTGKSPAEASEIAAARNQRRIEQRAGAFARSN